MQRCAPFVLVAMLVLPCLSSADVTTIEVARWEAGELNRWTVERFAGATDYTIVREQGKNRLSAVAKGSASGLFLEHSIDLNKTPWLTWSWRVTEPLSGLDERSKSGDDYAARLYVVISGGAFFWCTRALNYVWSGSQAPGTTWPNAYTDNARMIAVRGEKDRTGEWVTEKRNVLDDLRSAFGEEISHIDGIAIMTDADNSGGRAAADYGPVRFSAD
jgi:hypothetical protein